MSWGYKIAIAYGSFVLMILYFLFVAFQQSNELIEDHYYEKELQFQNVLNAENNLSQLNTKASIRIENDQVRIELPKNASDQVTDGKIEFIRLSDKSKDIRLNFESISNGTIILPVDKFIIGVYQLKIQWRNQGIPFMYNEQFHFKKP